jgi:hypothetical protein
MKDFLGQTIQENDRVISYYLYGYTGLIWGTVIRFTPKMVKVKFEGKSSCTIRYPIDLVVMGEEQQKALLVKVLKS